MFGFKMNHYGWSQKQARMNSVQYNPQVSMNNFSQAPIPTKAPLKGQNVICLVSTLASSVLKIGQIFPQVLEVFKWI